MKSEIMIQARAFPTVIRDERLGVVMEDKIVLTKDQLRAAEMVGESSKELIYRIYNRRGYRVLDVGKPGKHALTVDLFTLYREQTGGAISPQEELTP